MRLQSTVHQNNTDNVYILPVNMKKNIDHNGSTNTGKHSIYCWKQQDTYNYSNTVSMTNQNCPSWLLETKSHSVNHKLSDIYYIYLHTYTLTVRHNYVQRKTWSLLFWFPTNNTSAMKLFDLLSFTPHIFSNLLTNMLIRLLISCW